MRLSRKKQVGFLMSAVLLSLLVMARKKRKQFRRYGVRPFLKQNKKHGQYEKLVKYMIENDEDEFFSYTRMSPKVFKYLLGLLKAELKKHPSRKNALSPKFRLVITIQ